MNKPNRPWLTCGQCAGGWYQLNISRQPVKCPHCKSKFWRMPRDFTITPQLRRATLLRAAMDVLIGNDICHFGRPVGGEILALPPAMATRWRAMPERYGFLFDETCSRRDCDAVVTELTKPLHKNQPITGSNAA